MAQDKTIHNILEVVVGTVDNRSSKQVQSGNLRKIATRVYTTNMDDAPEDIIRRNVFYILGQLFPKAVISHRSAYELKPTSEGTLGRGWQGVCRGNRRHIRSPEFLCLV